LRVNNVLGCTQSCDLIIRIHLQHMYTTHCVGIDVSKAKFDYAFLSDQQVRYQGICANDPRDITEWIQKLETHGVRKDTPCVLESTGIYHVPVSLLLRDAGYTVHCINPILTRKYQQSSIRGAKTDAIDARRLAEIGIIESGLPIFTATRAQLYQRRLMSTLATLEREYQSLKRSFGALQESADALGVTESIPGKALVTEMGRTMRSLESEIIARAPTHARILAETPGVSLRAAAILLATLEGKTFAHRDQLTAFVGLDIRVRQSGTYRGRGKLSKRGDGYLRKVLHQIAWGLKRYDPYYQALYARLRAEKRHYTECLVIIARKFLRRLHATYFRCPQTAFA